MSQFYDTSGFDEPIDISSNTRKFQTSIIIKQDQQKSGILSFLEESEEATGTPPTSQAPTIKPSAPAGGYS